MQRFEEEDTPGPNSTFKIMAKNHIHPLKESLQRSFKLCFSGSVSRHILYQTIKSLRFQPTINILILIAFQSHAQRKRITVLIYKPQRHEQNNERGQREEKNGGSHQFFTLNCTRFSPTISRHFFSLYTEITHKKTACLSNIFIGIG